jgi:S-adenosylmethionine hydrolase
VGHAPAITLTTDFGSGDGYAAAIKGVLLTGAPGIPLLDLTHEIPPYDRVAALLMLRNALPRFPAGTVHLVVIDPGVGTARRGLVVHAAGQWLVGPDNGIVSGVFPAAQSSVYALHEARFAGASPTFHGRDVFAPAAAQLARGAAVETLGAPITDAVRLPLPMASRLGNIVKGEVIHADRFGNLISNVAKRALNDAEHVAVSLNQKPVRFGKTFSDVEMGEPVAYWGSGGLLEVAVREGSAKVMFGGPGLSVEVVRFG